MNINDIKINHKTCLSFEVFPPKQASNVEKLFETISALAVVKPAFISVTYGAGGGQRDKTVAIASRIKTDYGIEPLAHLTCVGADESTVTAILNEMNKNGIDNILALRGDVPKNMNPNDAFKHYKHATDLIEHIKNHRGFYTFAAAYPEGHPQSPSLHSDIDYLKAKQDLGAVRLNTTMCFDTDTILDFLEKSKKIGITIPISIGVMPILNPSQILRMVSLSGCSIPVDLAKLFALYGNDEDAFRKHGMDYAKAQIMRLLDNGIDGLHLYTMNKHEAILEILEDVDLI